MISEPLRSPALEFLCQESPTVYLRMDTSGRVLDVNETAVKTIGDDVWQMTFAEIFVDFQRRLSLTELARPPGKTHRLDVTTHGSEPRTFFFRFFADGPAIVCLGFPDWAGENRVRQQILQLNAKLANLTRQLHKANAELARLNELKSRFLGMAAHDLRKPVGLVMTYGEFLLDEAADLLDEEQVGFLRTIYRSAGFMRRLIDDFLDLAMIESGRLSLELAEVELPTVCQHALELCEVAARKKRISLVVRGIDELSSSLTMMDGSKIEQVLLNLLSNAIEHTGPDSQVELLVRQEASEFRIGVRDQGPGISDAELARLFFPYERGSSKKTAGEKSTGLGLAIAKQIVDAHEGKIWAESAVGVGTTFWFTVPARNRDSLGRAEEEG